MNCGGEHPTMKVVIHDAGQVSFAVPDDWVEARDGENTLVLYPRGQPSGTLRLDVITAQLPSHHSGTLNTAYLRNLLDLQARSTEGRVELLPNGNVLHKYAERRAEGDDLLIHHWEIANASSARAFRLAIFSFTILAEDEFEQTLKSSIELIDVQLRAARFLAISEPST
ncbi:unnamed protein product [Phaeothamnion confervicola]